MRVAEIFRSIQGEGLLVGTPSTFVRLSGCNLRCSWCDTKFASWEPEGDSLTVDQIVNKVESLVPMNERVQHHVVITGGEPMIFKAQGDGIKELVFELRKYGHHVTISLVSGTL